MRENIINFLEKENKTYGFKEIGKSLNINDQDLEKELSSLLHDGIIYLTKNNKYIS